MQLENWCQPNFQQLTLKHLKPPQPKNCLKTKGVSNTYKAWPLGLQHHLFFKKKKTYVSHQLHCCGPFFWLALAVLSLAPLPFSRRPSRRARRRSCWRSRPRRRTPKPSAWRGWAWPTCARPWRKAFRRAGWAYWKKQWVGKDMGRKETKHDKTIQNLVKSCWMMLFDWFCITVLDGFAGNSHPSNGAPFRTADIFFSTSLRPGFDEVHEGRDPAFRAWIALAALWLPTKNARHCQIQKLHKITGDESFRIDNLDCCAFS